MTYSPQFLFSLDYLQLSLNCDRPYLAYSLILKHKDQVLAQIEASREETEQLWIALAESMENGLALEVKLSLAKHLIPQCTPSFA